MSVSVTNSPLINDAPESTDIMIMAVELELQRLGGYSGLLRLLRAPPELESSGAFIARVELAAALIACITVNASNSIRCGGIVLVSSLEGRVPGEDYASGLHREDNAPAPPVEYAEWEAAVLMSVIDILQGSCTLAARTIFLRVIATLGNRIQDAGVASRLFHVLSDGIRHNDAQCCGYVSRALAVGMHADAEFSRQSACMYRITVLLALAFPGRVSISPQDLPWDFCKRKGGVEAPPVYPMWSLVSGNCAGMARENALSCLNSILMASDTAGEIIRVAKGVEPLFLLTMGEEPPSSSCSEVHDRLTRPIYGEEAPSYRQRSTTRARARTSVSSSNPTSASRGDFPPPAPGCKRLRTAGATPLKKSSACPRRHREPSDAPPAIGGTSSEISTVENVRVIEGEGEAKERNSSKETRLGASAIDVRSPEEASMPGTKIGCVDRLEKGASLIGLSPRAGLYAIEFGVDRAGRLRILATSCLVRCLQKRKTGAGAPGRREAVVGSDNRDEQSSSDDSNVSPASGAALGEERRDEKSRGSSVASSVRRHHKRLKASRKGITATVVTRPYKRENKTRRREHSMPKRTVPTRDGIDSDQHPLDAKPYGWCGNDATVGIYHRVGIEGRDVSAGEGQESRHHQSTKVFVELEQLGAVRRAPELLRAENPLLQELGVLLLLHGVEHGRHRPLLSQSGTRGSGYLRSLCWLLLHRRQQVSRAAATLMAALASRPQRGGWILALIEQGCVPLLRMVTGAPSFPSALKKGVDNTFPAEDAVLSSVPHRSVATPDRGREPPDVKGINPRGVSGSSGQAGQLMGPQLENVIDDAAFGGRPSRQDPGRIEKSASDKNEEDYPRETAKVILKTLSKEATTRYLERLVRIVRVSGNPELRKNIALGLVLLSTENTETQRGKKARRSFVTGGALAGVLGMLRSPTGRPGAVSFLRMVAALLDDPQPPVEFSGVGLPEGGTTSTPLEELEEKANSNRRTGGGDLDDSIFLVQDPLACFRKDDSKVEKEEGSRGGKAETEGIKMACPPRDVICQASSELKRLMAETPHGRLPLLSGRYKTWEEVMAHIGAPHTFGSSCSRYSTAFLLEMFAIAARFSIKSQVDMYARQLRQRFLLKSVVQERVTHTATMKHVTSTESKAEGKEYWSGKVTKFRRLDSDAFEDIVGAGSGLTFRESNPLESKDELDVLTLLDVSLTYQHEWLCSEAFRQVVATMGGGGGAGLLLHPPRDLTSTLGLLQKFISILFAE